MSVYLYIYVHVYLYVYVYRSVGVYNYMYIYMYLYIFVQVCVNQSTSSPLFINRTYILSRRQAYQHTQDMQFSSSGLGGHGQRPTTAVS